MKYLNGLERSQIFLDVHSVNEHLSIKSVERVWEFTKALLKEMK